MVRVLTHIFNCKFLIQNRSPIAKDLLTSVGFQFEILPETDDYRLEAESISRFITSKDVFIIDGYQFPKAYIGIIQKMTLNTIEIDDLNHGKYISSLVINHNFHAIEEKYDYDISRTKILRGVRYALLRKEFFYKGKDAQRHGVTICLGGSDVKNISDKVYRSLRRCFNGSIRLILGGANIHKKFWSDKKLIDPELSLLENLGPEEMREVMLTSKLFICTASVISLEASSVGTALVVGSTEANQVRMSEFIGENGLGIHIGNFYSVSDDALTAKIAHALQVNPERMIVLQKKLFDGKSGERLAGEIVKMIIRNERTTGLNADYKLMIPEMVGENYLSWFSDNEVKRNIEGAKASVTLESLKEYVQKRSDDPTTFMWGIFQKDGTHIGNIKYEPTDFKNGVAVMGILIGDQKWRGKGLAREAIFVTSSSLKEFGIHTVYLGVSSENLSAIKAYSKMGFLVSSDNYLKIPAEKGFEMKLNLSSAEKNDV